VEKLQILYNPERS